MTFVRSGIIAFVSILLCCQSFTLAKVGDDHTQHQSCIILPKKKTGNVIFERVRPRMEFQYVTPKGYFKIHYDTTEAHAVRTIDRNSNKIPDYIDSVASILDEAYEVEVNKLGFRKPIPDFDDPKTTDIYVVQLGKAPGFSFESSNYVGYYGITVPEDSYQSSCSPDTSQSLNTSSAFMLIDNDFAETDSLYSISGKARRTYSDTGYAALRVTCYHEFNHVLQMAYKFGEISQMFFELTSTWLEHIADPNTTDYFQYLKGLFNSSESEYLSDNDNAVRAGYNHAFVLQYLQKNFGNTIASEWWELIGSCVEPYTALDSVCKRRGTTFPAQWNTMMKWIYFTNYRAKDTTYFSNAVLMPLIKPNNDGGNNGSDMEYTNPSYGRSISLYPFQFKLVRCLLPSTVQNTPDTVDFIATNTNIENAIHSSKTSTEYQLTITRGQISNSVRIGASDYYYTTTVLPKRENFYDTLFYNGGFVTQLLSSPYPQPLSISKDKMLTFPIPDDIPAGSNVKLTVFSPDIGGYEVENKFKPGYARVIVIDKKRVIQWDAIPAELSTGIYVYSIEYNDKTFLGKFLVNP
ncbi:MAG: hypothetical protein U0Y96_06625 [Candidatus Kapaibacterium sp.]